jgi:uncharacterized protein YbcV (DUF1398 family)
MRLLKLFSTLALIAILCVNTLSATPNDVIVGSSTTSITVSLTNINHQTVKVQILNDRKNIVSMETLKNKPDGIKNYNMEQMEDGDYSLVVIKQGSRITQPFSIKEGQVTLSEADKKEIYFPFFKLKADKLEVNALATAYGTITVNIIDAEDNNILTDNHPKVLKVHKRFDITRLPEGTYTAEVIVDGESFRYFFSR